MYEDDVIKKQFTITGGSGPSDTTTVTIERITSSDAIFLAGNSAVIEYNFTSVDNTGDTTGNGTATWRVGSTTVATTVAAQGKNSFDITQYLKMVQTLLDSLSLTVLVQSLLRLGPLQLLTLKLRVFLMIHSSIQTR